MYPIELSKDEFILLRQSLDIIQIQGKSAKFVANLQINLEYELIQIQEIIKQEEAKKQAELVKISKK
jgi:hypothetical protein